MQKQTSITAFAVATPRYARVARPFSSPLVPRKRPKRGPGRPPKKQQVDVLDSQYHTAVVADHQLTIAAERRYYESYVVFSSEPSTTWEYCVQVIKMVNNTFIVVSGGNRAK